MSAKISKSDIFKLYTAIQSFGKEAENAAKKCYIDTAFGHLADYEKSSERLAELVGDLMVVGAMPQKEGFEVTDNLASMHDVDYLGTLRRVKTALETNCKCKLEPLAWERLTKKLKEKQ